MGWRNLFGKAKPKFDPVYLIIWDQPQPPTGDAAKGIVNALVQSGDLAPPTENTRYASTYYEETWDTKGFDFTVHVLKALTRVFPELAPYMSFTDTEFRIDDKQVKWWVAGGEGEIGKPGLGSVPIRFCVVQVAPL